eukprot:CAMPEP_0170596108 /NCGR_PEP_ID=MMETSP0224-20130122/14928_1 /TAXON_ID=285029 /ORGANISM="Togula jolla, Strain CCCM 725" /LENGTH=112 /DNA_ID=CAMNT_0010920351 /DNA_START=150 /DNA_END=488 /DNA_ORIENTATION=-
MTRTGFQSAMRMGGRLTPFCASRALDLLMAALVICVIAGIFCQINKFPHSGAGCPHGSFVFSAAWQDVRSLMSFFLGALVWRMLTRQHTRREEGVARLSACRAQLQLLASML